MDASKTRRGQDCWYLVVSSVCIGSLTCLRLRLRLLIEQPKIGMIAINDAFMLETAIYVLLKSISVQKLTMST